MNSRGKFVGAGKGYRARNPQMAPVSKAVRNALALSALALASVSGTAFACDPPVVGGGVTSVECNDASYLSGIGFNVVDDLTVVVNNLGGGVAITPGIGEVGIGLTATGSASLGIYGGTTITTDGASGVSVVATGGLADVNNAGNIYATDGFGIEVVGFDGATVTNEGVVAVDGTGFVQGISAVSPYGLASVTNNGDVRVDSDDVGFGVYAGGGGGALIINTGSVDAYGINAGIGLGAYGDGSGVAIDNQGQVYAASKYGMAAAIAGYGDDVTVTNSGIASAFTFYGDAMGVLAYAGTGVADVTNSIGGDIRASAFEGSATGIQALGYEGASVLNQGSVNALGYTQATGILAYSAGAAEVYSTGTVVAQSYLDAVGIWSRGDTAAVTNAGVVQVTSQYQATGLRAESFGGEAVVDNFDRVEVYSALGVATGIEALGADGAIANNYGSVYAYGELGAYGVVADGGLGDALASSVGLVVAETRYGNATGVLAFGDTAEAGNGGGVFVTSVYGTASGVVAEGLQGAYARNYGTSYVVGYLGATAVRAYTVDGVAGVLNTDLAYARSDAGDAFGVYAYSTNGDAVVTNSGIAVGLAVNGIGDGIFASGENVTVDNQGQAYGIGFYFGAGIEAQGDVSVAVTNGLGSLAYGYGGYYGFGIYATGGAGGAVVTNDGTAVGLAQLYGFGIYAESGGNTSVVNSGTGVVEAGDLNNTALGTGIHAGTYGIDGVASVDNAGSVIAAGYYGATGIEALALSPGGVATVTNSGVVTADQYTKYGVGAVGILSVGDTQASIDNQYGGQITATSAGQAYGALAISQAGDASVTNAGTIAAYSTQADKYYGAYGVVAVSGYGYASVDNSGLVVAASTSYYGSVASAITAQGTLGATVTNSGDAVADGKYANAIVAIAGQGDALVDNSGVADAYGKYAFGIQAISTLGDGIIDNSGEVFANGTNYAVGLFAASTEGNAQIDNSGVVEVEGYNFAYGAFAQSAYGDVSIVNGGAIGAYAYYGAGVGIGAVGQGVSVENASDIFAAGIGSATGILAVGYGTATVTNAGEIAAISYGDATGIYAISPDGIATVDNTGYIGAGSLDYDATGIRALSINGDVAVNQGGDVYAVAKYGNATGVFAQGANASVTGDGYTYALGYTSAMGIVALGTYGASVDVGGEIRATGTGYAMGIYAYSLQGDVDIASAGVVYADADGRAVGIQGFAPTGDSVVGNDGAVFADSYGGEAVGLISRSTYGTATATNTGDISATTLGSRALGIVAQGNYANASNTGSVLADGISGAAGIIVFGTYGASIDNAGDVVAESQDYRASGLYAISVYGEALVANGGSASAYNATGLAFAAYANSVYGDATLDNAGSLVATSPVGQAVGAVARAEYGSALVTNSGDITVVGGTTAIGAFALGLDAAADNSGSIDAYGTSAFGIYVTGLYTATVGNSGTVTAEGSNGSAIGAAAISYDGDATLDNTGDLLAYTDAGVAAGAYVVAYGEASITNGGTITGTAADAAGTAYGLVAIANGDVSIDNSGTISAVHDTLAIAVRMSSDTGTARLYNSGLVDAGSLGGGSIAVVGSAGVDEVHNTGRINGHIITGDGDDLVNNGAGGEWYLGGSSTNLGAGNDTIDNAGLVVIGNGTVYLGDGDDAIVNSGDMVLGYAGIDLGAADTANTFDNTGTIHVIGDAFVQMGAGGTLYNDGTIRFLDGATDDLMTIYGNLGGAGDLNVDIDFIAGTSDLLYVEGDITGDTKTINVAAVNLPDSLTFDPIQVVVATGAADADAFVAGQLFGFESELVEFGLSVEHAVVGTDNVFSIGIGIDGLSNAGNLAATLAPGVQSMVGVNIGTLRQRLGVLPDLGGELNGLGPWVRAFSNTGDVDATGTGFAAGEDLRFSNDIDGTEVGMNFTIGHGFHYGVLLAKTDNVRSLSGGTGRDDMKLDGVGLYATWLADDFYVDASWRWMDFTSWMRTGTDQYRSSGNARAMNVEAGYTGWQVGGFSLVPQLQYTRASIDNIDSFGGLLTEVALDGGDSERLRVGLGVERSFTTAGGFRLTPYGSLNAVNEMDGASGFVINGDASLSGGVEADGTFGLVELGLGVQKNGWSGSAGVNWADGGAVDGDFGAQVVVRYTW